MDSLLSSKFTLGGDASVAAGPVGTASGRRDRRVDVGGSAVCTLRSKGVFAGLELNGTVISAGYGTYGGGRHFKGVTASEVLKEEQSQSAGRGAGVSHNSFLATHRANPARTPAEEEDHVQRDGDSKAASEGVLSVRLITS